MADERKKEKSQGFAALGVPVGSILTYKKTPEITVKTLDDKNKVEYEGKPYSISTLAKQLVGSPVSGYLYFKYEGKILKDLAKKEDESPKSTETAESPVPAPAPAEEPGESPETPPTPSENSIPDIDPLAWEKAGNAAETDSEEAKNGEEPPQTGAEG